MEFDGDDEENTCDVRLQVYADDPMYPQWALRWGASDYDLDHRGYWGASCIAADDDTHDIYATVAELIDQSRDAYAEQNGAE